ncbi:MAG: DNA-directed RNA polymerase [Desulfurococcales archaeon]|nr:DNA-directed RNA polymerase [Desulfurococcales archaeon]NOZ31301.1 DNA-directed RNA polymerase [Thermoproteota archaeon]
MLDNELDGSTVNEVDQLYVEVEAEEWIGLLTSPGEDVNKAALAHLREQLEGKLDQELGGIIIAVLDAEVVSEGVLLPLPGDPQIYYVVRYKMLVYKPLLLEVIRGIVREAREIGIFVDLGPIDGFVFRNQIMDEPIEFLPERRAFKGVQSNRMVEINDVVRARITQIGKDRRGYGIRVGLTMRQPYLGKEEWIKGGM